MNRNILIFVVIYYAQACHKLKDCESCVDNDCLWYRISKEGEKCIGYEEQIKTGVLLKISNPRLCSKINPVMSTTTKPAPEISIRKPRVVPTTSPSLFNNLSTLEPVISAVGREMVSPSPSSSPSSSPSPSASASASHKSTEFPDVKSPPTRGIPLKNADMDKTHIVNTKTRKILSREIQEDEEEAFKSDVLEPAPEVTSKDTIVSAKSNMRWVSSQSGPEFLCPYQPHDVKATDNWQLNCLVCLENLELAKIKRKRHRLPALDKNIYKKRLYRCLSLIK
ncbi:B-cell CLL/lymphoma 9-like protein [Folsomia candida]|uniref:B-cell CLL/lymphoma 9-like protein n=1 Tax=Folsomia candida TaxID=158441 RepID=A0A226DCG5_FOLCA|nr:B-cell CLL/lymphoma 9-like protein [Folsomia candida]